MSRLGVARAVAMGAVVVVALPARSQVETNGYVRVGGGATGSPRGNQTCFKLGGAETKYRLGNECEIYSELMLSMMAFKGNDGASMKVHFMLYAVSPLAIGDNQSLTNPVTLQSPLVGTSRLDFGYAQLYIDGQNIPGLGGAIPWVGRRYYKREDVHIIDFYYWNPSGIGGGLEDIRIGKNLKLSYAVFTADTNVQSAFAFRQDLQLRGIRVNPGGELQLGMDVITAFASDPAIHNGWWATIEHVQALLGGWNKLAFQYGMASGFGIGNPTNGNANLDNLKLTSASKRWRVVENLYVQPSREIGLQGVFVFQHSTSPPSGSSNWLSIGARLAYAFAAHLKVLLEVGHDTVTPVGQPAQLLTKVTVAPVLTAGEGFFARPELRLFYTFASWSPAARNAGVDSAGVFTNTDKTNGSTFGLQGEVWW